MQSDRCASSGAAAPTRSRPSTASSTCTATVARCWASSAFVWERMSSRASSAAVRAGRTERSQSTSRPCRRRAGDQEADEERREGDDHRQEHPAPRLGARRGLGRLVVVVVAGCDVVVSDALVSSSSPEASSSWSSGGRRWHCRRGRRRQGGRGDRCASSWSCPGQRRLPTGRRVRPAWRRSRGTARRCGDEPSNASGAAYGHGPARSGDRGRLPRPRIPAGG